MDHGSAFIGTGRPNIITLSWFGVDPPSMIEVWGAEFQGRELLAENPFLREMKVEAFLCRGCAFLGMDLDSRDNKISGISQKLEKEV